MRLPHGMGVGLSIIRRTVEYWGGTIEAQSEIGQGGTFASAATSYI